MSARRASRSRLLNASYMAEARSTFSCDIGLLRQSDGFQRLGAVEVVVGLDDQAVPKTVNDGERPGVGGACALADHARASDQTAISDIDQFVEAHLDRPDQLDQRLHPGERSGTSTVDLGIGPSRSLAVHGIVCPELLRDRLRTGLVPDLIGPTDAVCVLLRHRLLRKSGGFEGFVAVGVPLASHHEAVTQGPKVPDANVEPRAAGSPTSGRPKEDEHLVIQVPETLRFHAK